MIETILMFKELISWAVVVAQFDGVVVNKTSGVRGSNPVIANIYFERR